MPRITRYVQKTSALGYTGVRVNKSKQNSISSDRHASRHTVAQALAPHNDMVAQAILCKLPAYIFLVCKKRIILSVP